MLMAVGKRTGRSLMVTVVAGLPTSCLFYILDKASRRRFLVDTGATISVLTPSAADRRNQQFGKELQAANGSVIATFGLRPLTLNLGLRRPYYWIFTVADVAHPILGADFFGHVSLTVDVKNQGAN
uniref:Peptidase A2 domain-containing protein n=1 Tax=Amphimedon queenslandica TaxID=400682 RepID=A0A1X7TEJ6_AMPQE